MTFQTRTLGLITEIKTYLEAHGDDQAGVDIILGKLNELSLDEGSMVDVDSSYPVQDESLDTAIRNMPRQQLGPIANAIESAKHALHWRVDKGFYYEDDADVGPGYANGNMHCRLVGPERSPIPADDFELGLFLLCPKVLYRDHSHLAPEFYFNLTGPTGWRFEQGPWQDYPAGTIIWNKPHAVHATRVYDQPFLSVYAWSKDINSKCRVIPANDWRVIEDHLQKME